MLELQPGLWHWQARHPEWSDGQPWSPEVSSYAMDDGTHLLLFDPLGVPSEIEQLAGRRERVVFLTAPWHAERSACMPSSAWQPKPTNPTVGRAQV